MWKKGCDCLVFIVISIALGVALGIASYTIAIPGITNVLWAITVIGFATLLMLWKVGKNGKDKCICGNGLCLAVGAMGLLVTAIIALAITITTGVVAISVLLGFATFFLVLTLLSLLRMVICSIIEACFYRE